MLFKIAALEIFMTPSLLRNLQFPSLYFMGFPGGSEGKASASNAGKPRFDPWAGKIPWRRKRQPTPVFLPEESHGRRSLVGYSPRGHKESDTTEWLHFHFLFILYHCVSFLTVPCSAWILVPWPGIGPALPVLKAQCLNHWTAREVYLF